MEDDTAAETKKNDCRLKDSAEMGGVVSVKAAVGGY